MFIKFVKIACLSLNLLIRFTKQASFEFNQIQSNYNIEWSLMKPSISEQVHASGEALPEHNILAY